MRFSLKPDRPVAFTLIELLFVIAVTTTLAAPSIAGTHKARTSAILTTADHLSWTANPLHLFLDGSVEGSVAREGIWAR
jgi:hypothetical protein